MKWMLSLIELFEIKKALFDSLYREKYESKNNVYTSTTLKFIFLQREIKM